MRADLLLVAKGLAESRAKAQAAIAAGGVTANGVAVTKPSEQLDEGAALSLEAPHPWVSRAGVKLAQALELFGVDPAGRACLDVGASTGGFTEVLLARRARHVVAVDVGQGQLHAKLAADARVTSLENTDARALTPLMLPEAPSLIVCDASFIGAAKVLAVPLALAAEEAELITLIKPQFEAGPGKAGKNGVLDDDTARRAAADAMAGLDGMEGFSILSFADSPVRGKEGNLELLMYARKQKRPG